MLSYHIISYHNVLYVFKYIYNIYTIMVYINIYYHYCYYYYYYFTVTIIPIIISIIISIKLYPVILCYVMLLRYDVDG